MPPAYHVLLKGVWGRFGWLEVMLPAGVYKLLATATAGVAGAALLTLWRERRRIDRGVTAFVALVVLILFAGLHWTDYQLLRTTGFMQGRYLLPLVSVAGLAVAAAVRLAPRERRATLVGAVLAGLVGLQLLSLGTMLERFYA
jgi:hypothetical protein